MSIKWVGAAALVAMSATANANYTADFNTGPGNWGGTGGTPSFSWVASGGVGNSGYIKAVDIAAGQMAVKTTGLGDLTSLVGGTFSFAYNVLGIGPGNTYMPNNAFGTVTFYSGSQWVSADLIPNIASNASIAGTGWHTASLGLIDNLWLGTASLSSILTNVTLLTINVEYDSTQRWPDESVGIDNVSIRGIGNQVAAGDVPEPATGALMIGGLMAAALAARRRKR